MLYLGRVLSTPRVWRRNPAFRGGDGQPAASTPAGLVYDGNSQGGIMGGALTALAPDFTTAKLGVPA